MSSELNEEILLGCDLAVVKNGLPTNMFLLIHDKEFEQ